MAEQGERDQDHEQTRGIYEAPDHHTVIFEHDEDDPDNADIIDLEHNESDAEQGGDG